MNRDPSKVIAFLGLHAQWLQESDLRVGQFIQNVAQYMGWDDPFYIENDILLEGMQKFINKLQRERA